MPEKLAKYLPNLSQAERDTLFGSITSVRSLPSSDPTRQGVIAGTSAYSHLNPCSRCAEFLKFIAYDATMKTMIIAATVLSVFPILFSLFMPNWYLGDKQNAVDAADLTGEVGAAGEGRVADEEGS